MRASHTVANRNTSRLATLAAQTPVTGCSRLQAGGEGKRGDRMNTLETKLNPVRFEKAEAIKTLRKYFRPGDTVFTVLRHVSGSGMFRLIDVYAIKGGTPIRLTYHASKALDIPRDKKREGLRVSGCGMDMGFSIAYDLSSTLFRNGYPCTGERCNANDHSNGDRNYEKGHCVHKDGGYALRHAWL